MLPFRRLLRCSHSIPGPKLPHQMASPASVRNRAQECQTASMPPPARTTVATTSSVCSGSRLSSNVAPNTTSTSTRGNVSKVARPDLSESSTATIDQTVFGSIAATAIRTPPAPTTAYSSTAAVGSVVWSGTTPGTSVFGRRERVVDDTCTTGVKPHCPNVKKTAKTRRGTYNSERQQGVGQTSRTAESSLWHTFV